MKQSRLPRFLSVLVGGASLCLGLVACSSGGGTAPADDSAAKSNFTRPMTDAEKAKGGAAPSAPSKAPIGG